MTMKRFVMAVLLSVAWVGMVAQQEPAVASGDNAAAVQVQKDVEFGTAGGEKLLLDVYQPPVSGGGASAKPRAAVVLIHGGGWSSLDKGTMARMGQFLARNGFVAVSVNYRLFVIGHGAEKKNPWPAQLDDVQRSVRWLRANAAKYNIDPEQVGAFGHSAGAQLAALLGMEDTRDNSDAALAKYSSRVQAVVDVSGVTDFSKDGDPDGWMANFFGGDKTKAAEVWNGASPVFHVAKDVAPFLIVHGTKDEQVPMAQPEELYEKLMQAGVPVTMVKVEDVHTFQTDVAKRELAVESLAFFRKYLGEK